MVQMSDMHIAWVTCILPQDMTFPKLSDIYITYPLFTAKFNGEGGTVQHLTVKYIYKTPHLVLHFLEIYM